VRRNVGANRTFTGEYEDSFVFRVKGNKESTIADK